MVKTKFLHSVNKLLMSCLYLLTNKTNDERAGRDFRRWHEEYEFSGKLKTEDCTVLLTQMESDVGTGAPKPEETGRARKWLKQAEKREEGCKKWKKQVVKNGKSKW